MTIDSGGAIAIKGFNYQKAVIAYIAVLNFNKNDFYIVPEGKEDAEVRIANQSSFIQIKSEKLSLTKLLVQDKKTQKSILGKLFSKKCDGVARYKIVTPPMFSDKDKKELIRTQGALLDCDVFQYSPEQRKQISDSLEKESYSSTLLNLILDNSFLALSPFEPNYDIALKYVIGAMVEKNICVDNRKGRTALTELCTQIDIKSEIKITGEPCDPNLANKRLDQSFFQKILKTNDYESLRNFLIKDLLDSCQFQIMQKADIRKDLYKIDSIHQKLRRLTCEKMKDVNVINGEEVSLIYSLHNSLTGLSNDKDALFAVIIDIVADKIMENKNDN